MSEQAPETPPTTPVQQPPAVPPQPQTPPVPPASPTPADVAARTQPLAPPADSDPGKVDGLPKWAQKLIGDLRAENANTRTTAKEKAADEARQALAQEIGKTLGLVTDGDKVDPEQLAKDLSEAKAQQQQSAIALAVYKAAKSTDEATRLLDSTSFMTSMSDIDPADQDKVRAAIDQAITTNPWLRPAQAAAGRSGTEFAGGSGERPKSLAEQIAEAEQAGDHKRAIALKTQQLLTKQ